MSEPSNKSVMDKIRKCLALSESSNEHEAAAAMRQARKLMEKHGLSSDDMSIFKIKDEAVNTIYTNPPAWFLMLATVVGKAFQCTVFTTYKRLTFVGKDACAEVAGYSFDILLRQLMRQKKEFINSDKVMLATPSVKRKIGQSYAEGWIYGVNKIVSEFASKITEQQEAEHTQYMEQLTKRPVSEAKEKKQATGKDSITQWAAGNGYRSGKDVKLHEGVAAGAQPLRIGAQV